MLADCVGRAVLSEIGVEERPIAASDVSATTRAKVRRAVADYMRSEGCSCCQDVEAHRQHAKRLAELLGVPAYSDRSGFDFGRFRSKKRTKKGTKE